MYELINKKEIKKLDIIKISLKLVKVNYKVLMLIALFFLIPSDIITTFFEPDIKKSGIAFYVLLKIILSSFSVLVISFSSILVFYLVQDSITDVTVKRSFDLILKGAVSNIIPLIKTNILASIIVIFMTLLLIIPGIIWGTYYLFYIQVIALKNLSGKKALDYSKYLVNGRVVETFIKFIILSFISLLPSLFVDIISNLLPLAIIYDVLFLITNSFCLLFLSIVYAVLFFNYENQKTNNI